MALPLSTREAFRNYVEFMEAKPQYVTEEVRKIIQLLKTHKNGSTARQSLWCAAQRALGAESM